MKISIIVPVYNVSAYISECIDSVIAQKGDIECVIVNDCTQDDSMSIVENNLENYCGNVDFKIIEHSINMGLSAARNTGINAATGDYIIFLDSDDKLSINAIEKMRLYLKNNNFPCCIIGNYETFGVNSGLFPKNHRNLNLLTANEEILCSYLECKWYPMAWNKLISRRFILSNSLYFEVGMLHEDELWSYQLALKLPSLQVCHEVTYFYRIRADSITKRKGLKNYEDNLLYCEYILENQSNKYERETHIFLQNRLNVILLDMYKNRCTIDEIWYMSKVIKRRFGIHCYWSLKRRNLFNLVRSILLFKKKNILKLYLDCCVKRID